LIARALRAPDVAERLTSTGLEPQLTTSEAFAAEIRRDVARFGVLVKKLDIPLQ
jgi:tripartite-type tricarboxylate transporter receptor subunit TctC